MAVDLLVNQVRKSQADYIRALEVLIRHETELMEQATEHSNALVDSTARLLLIMAGGAGGGCHWRHHRHPQHHRPVNRRGEYQNGWPKAT